MTDGIVDAPASEVSDSTENQENQSVGVQTKPGSNGKDSIKTAVDNAMRKHKLKIDGEEVEVDDEELKRGYQLRKASDKRFQEGMAARKQAEEFINILRTDPMKILKDPRIGIDVKNLAEKYLAEEIEDQMLSPEQKELKAAKRQLAEYEEFKKQQETLEEQKRSEYIREHYKQQYEQEIISALQSSALPKTEHTVKRMAYYMSEALKKGYELSAKDVTDLVKQDYQNEIKALFGQTDGDTLLSMLGDDVAKKIRTSDLKRVKGAPKTFNNTQDEKPRALRTSNKNDRVSMDDWKARLERIKNGEE